MKALYAEKEAALDLKYRTTIIDLERKYTSANEDSRRQQSKVQELTEQNTTNS